jgi:hypothetical protein
MTNFIKLRNKVKQLAYETQDDHTIIPHGNGYRVSNRFIVKQQNGIGWSVYDEWSENHYNFMTSRNAIAFCMALNANNRDLAYEIYGFDVKYQRKQFDVQNKIYILSQNDIDPDTRSIIVIKLDEDVKISKYLKDELQKRLNRAKYIKVKGSHYEFAGID